MTSLEPLGVENDALVDNYACLGLTVAVPTGSLVAYIIGGISMHGREESVLSIKCYDVASQTWLNNIYCNTKGLTNRSYHSTVLLPSISSTLLSSIYVFGGCINMATEQCSEEVIRIQENELGLSASVETTHECVARIGQSASVVGKDKKYAVLYGGITTKDKKKVYNSDLWLFQGDSASEGGQSFCRLECTPNESEPPGRAYHTATSFGDGNQYVLVFGGASTNDATLNDVWFLDLTAVLAGADGLLGKTPSPDAAAPTDKKDAKKPPAATKKGQPVVTVPCARWVQIKLPRSETVDAAFGPRRLHSSFFVPPVYSVSGFSEFCVFGGLNDHGPISARLCRLRADMGADGKLALLELVEPSEFEGDGSAEEHKAIGLDGALLPTMYGTATTLFFDQLSMGGNVDEEMLLAANTSVEEGGNGNAAVAAATSAQSSNATALLVFGGHCFAADAPTTLTSSASRMVLFDVGNITLTTRKGGPRTSRPVSAASGILDDINANDNPDCSWEGPLGIVYTYEGAIREGGIKHGDGRLFSSASGLVYDGQWANNEYHGEGKLYLENLDVYEGSFLNGEREGRGKLSSPDGTITDVEWKKDKIFAGKVSNFPIEGGVFEGTVLGGVPHCIDGTCDYVDGSSYQGEWRSGRRNGHGRWVSAKLEEYSGKWVGDKRNGRGKWTSPGGEWFDGVWDNDIPKIGERRYNDGSTYRGNFKNGERHGQGEMNNADGEKVLGIWSDDIFLIDE